MHTLSIITSELSDKMTSPELIRKLNRFIPDINQVEEYLKGDTEELISKFFPTRKPGVPVRPADLVMETKKQQKKLILEDGIRALEKIRLHKDVNLGLQEKFALCSIIINIGRPALLIQDDHFPQKNKAGHTGGLPPNWWILDDYRDEIEKTCKSVGRIEPCNSGKIDAPGGTGFLIAKDIVITNKHVVEDFAYKGDNMKWKIISSTKPRIDYAEEYGSNVEREFAVKKVIGVHETLDLALLKIKTKSSQASTLPEPLVLDSELPEPTENRNVYVVGYPFQGSSEENPRDVKLVFNDLYGFKRLQPGKARGEELQNYLLYHDCSTIGGNSGSCVVDLEKNTVIGLHFSGKLIQELNEAIPLPLLKNDPLLVKAGIKFG